jgi:hypothetical protein
MIEMMCDYPAPKDVCKQFAYVDPAGKFQRLKSSINNGSGIKACINAIPHKDVYESVYGWTDWDGGKLTATQSRSAVIDGIFLDFDDAGHPENALLDAAEVAQYVGHCEANFSGSKGAHLWIKCNPVDLIPDLKSSVLRGFCNMLADILPELSTMDWAVNGDTSRVKRIVNSVHSKTKLHAVPMSIEELSLCTIDEVRKMAANRRGLVQVVEPSQWVTDELYRIEEEILQTRLTRLNDREQIAGENYRFISAILQSPCADRKEIYETISTIEEEWRRIRIKKLENIPITKQVGRSPEETWLLKVVDIFKVMQRMHSIQPAGSIVSTSPSEHEARCHIVHLMDDCGWTRSEMHEVFSHADDYKHETTERMFDSLIGRR